MLGEETCSYDNSVRRQLLKSVCDVDGHFHTHVSLNIARRYNSTLASHEVELLTVYRH